MRELVGSKKSIETDTECYEGDLDADSIGDSDIWAITEKGEESEKEAVQTVEFVKTPEVASLEYHRVDDRRSQDDEESEEENMRGSRYRWCTCEPDDGKKEEEGSQEEEESMGEFEKEEGKWLRCEKSEKAFYTDPE